MNENSQTKSSFRTISQSVSSIFFKTTFQTKTYRTPSSIGRAAFRKIILENNSSLKKSSSSMNYPLNNSRYTTPVKKSVNHSSFEFRTSIRKTRNGIPNQVAFFKCLPKSAINIFKKAAPQTTNKNSGLSMNILKLFGDSCPKQKVQDVSLSVIGINQLKIFPIISPKKKLINILPNDSNPLKLKSSEEYLKCAYNPLYKLQKKIQIKHLNSILKEASVYYSQDFSLVKEENFSKKYRLVPGIISITKNPTKSDVMEKIIAQNKQFNSDINKILSAREKDRVLSHKKQLLRRFKTVMIRAAIHFKRINIPLNEFYWRNYDAITPFETEKSQLLFNLIKDKDIKKILTLVDDNYFLVHDFDKFHQTPLHWAAKRNVFQVIPYLVRKGACVDSRDHSGRIPLHIAALMNNMETVQLLLYELSNPFAKTNDGLTAIDLTSNSTIKYILHRTILLHTVRKMFKAKDFEKGVRRGLQFLFNDELKINFNLLKAQLYD